MAKRQSPHSCVLGLAAVLGLACFTLAPEAIGSARAAPKVSTKIVYYTVRGSTPNEMLTYMLRNGPHGNRGRALGTTNAQIRQTMKLSPKDNGCLINKHQLDVKMTLHLPKLAAGQKLSRSVRARWKSFAAYVRQHEKRHKSLYVACARRIDKRVRAVRGKLSCHAVRAKIRAIFAEENRLCERTNQAFDRREAQRVGNLPFLRQASSKPQFASTRKTSRRSATTIIRLER